MPISTHHRHRTQGVPGPGLSTLGRVVAAVAIWFTVLALLMVLVPRSAAELAVSATPGERPAAWSWPLDPLPQVERRFERPASRYGPGHRGIDLAGQRGQSVLAVADGIVTHSGMVAGRGTVTVRHANGIASTYEPLEDRIAADSRVSAGEPLGVIGTGSHCASESCLHLGARLGADYLDPLLLLTRVRIILLPLLPAA